MTKTIDADTWRDMWLPRRPYVSDDYARGVWQTTREKALQRRHVQANAPGFMNLIVADVDHPDALFRALNGNDGLYPTVIVENPHNGHAHLAWRLREPVTTTQAARRKPVVLAAAVTEGLRRLVDADPSYTQFLTKNPVHKDWITHRTPATGHRYDLADLAAKLTDAKVMPEQEWNPARRAKKGDNAALGRNCAIFDATRLWAYRQVKDCAGDAEVFGANVLAYATALNADFPEPLPTTEVGGIARSITKWVTTQYWGWTGSVTDYKPDFIEDQRRRAAKSVEKRQEKAKEQGKFLTIVRHSLTEGGTISETATQAGVSTRTVKRQTSQPRAEYLATVEQRRARIIELHHQGMTRRQITAAVGCSESTVKRALRTAR